MQRILIMDKICSFVLGRLIELNLWLWSINVEKINENEINFYKRTVCIYSVTFKISRHPIVFVVLINISYSASSPWVDHLNIHLSRFPHHLYIFQQSSNYSQLCLTISFSVLEKKSPPVIGSTIKTMPMLIFIKPFLILPSLMTPLIYLSISIFFCTHLSVYCPKFHAILHYWSYYSFDLFSHHPTILSFKSTIIF